MPKIIEAVGIGSSTGVAYPLNTNPVQMNPTQSPWTFGSYAQITASLPNNFVLCGAVVSAFTGSFQTASVIELATGGSGSEVVFERFGFSTVFNPPPTESASIVYVHTQPLAPQYIAAGTRLAARIAMQTSSAYFSPTMYLYGFTAPSPSLAARYIDAMQWMQGLATKGGDRLPNTSFIALSHAGTAWAAGAWIQIASSVSEDAIVEGITIQAITNRSFYVELGIGAPGSEQALPCFFPQAGQSIFLQRSSFVPSPRGLYIPRGSRLVARQYASSTTGTCEIAVKLSYLR
jgi:hypothetical protein